MSQSRRQFLKVMAAAPLILPLGLTASPLMRYLKPTMSPLGFCDPADQPSCAEVVSFTLSDFPDPWTCLPFIFPLKLTEFNPEQQEIREIPAFIIRTQRNEFVAFSRICPIHPTHGCFLNWARDPSIDGLAPKVDACFSMIKTPVLWCSCTMITFDLANDLRVIRGSAQTRPHKFELERKDNLINVVRPEPGAIC